MSKQKLHFMSNDASRTGAPVLLLRLIGELVKQDKFSIELFLLNGGPLAVEFGALVKTHVIYDPLFALDSISDRVKKKLGFHALTRKRRHEDRIRERLLAADVIFANTVVCIRYLQDLPLLNKRIFFYVHELHFVTKLLIADDQMQLLHRISEKIFVPALYVKQFLVKEHAYAPEKIHLLKYLIPFNAAETIKDRQAVFTVGACGSVNLRKGFDLFVLIVREVILKRKVTDILFYWIGVEKNTETFILLSNDLKKCGLESYVKLVEVTDQVSEHLIRLDVFLLTSREDPYPLVVMEAAAQSVPAIYFTDSGGISEFVQEGGIGVDYLDIPAFADAILKLKNDPQLLKDCSLKARDNLLKEQRALNIDALAAQLA